MNPKIGIGVSNGPGDIADLLEIGFGTYLVCHGDHAPVQVDQIRRRYPAARIYLRRIGGIGGSPADVAADMTRLFHDYARWGIIDLIAWNEPDRAEEGGFSSQQIAGFAQAFLDRMRQICPGARLHWPALAHLPRYQGSEPEIWLPVARQFDVIDFHAYHDPGNVRAFFRWIETFIPGKPIACTEYNWGPGNPRPPDYGAWLFEAYRQASQDFPAAEAVCPFIWEWIHPEPGIGTSLDIKRDEGALAGIRRAITDLGSGVVPEPGPAPPPPPEEMLPIPQEWLDRATAAKQKRYQRNWYDDGNDCISSSFAEALRLSYGEGLPDVPQMEAAYLRWHPDWDNNASTMVLDWYWEALLSIGIRIEALHQRSGGTLVDQIAAELAQGRHPTVWLYLWDTASRTWFHHAVVAATVADGALETWDPQVGIMRRCPVRQFLEPGHDMSSSGYAYAAYYQHVEVAPMSNKERFEPLARRIAAEHAIDPDTFCRQIEQESGWDPNAVSPSGAEGLGQLVPRFYPNVNRRDPEANLRAAASSMRSYLDQFGGDYARALAAYNGGPVAIRRWVEHFGDGWRAGLTRRPQDWPGVAGYGTPGKAHEVATYLDRILGSAPDRPEDNKMVKPPDGIKWIGTSNFSRGRDGHRPVAIVNHIMEGTLAACDSWFNNRESQVSAHFGIGQNGEIHQYVRTVDTAWANGRCNQPDLSVEWLADCVRRQVNPNSLTISIEHEGKTGDRMSEAQYQATLALHRYLIAEYGIPVDRMHIIGHNRIDSINRSRCPGAGFPWDRLLADLGGGTVQPQPGSRDHLPKEVVKPPEGIRWVGSPNFAADRAGHRPVAIVCHTLESTLAAADASFADPAAQVSTHFAIGRHGEKHQYVRTVDTAWGNGATNQPDLTIAWLAEAVQGGVNPNLLTVSLGFEGKSGEPLTEPQYQAGLELVRYLIDLWDVPVDKDHVIGHSRIDSVGQATCPGPAFPWDRLFGDLLSGPAEPQALTAVQALDEIWRIAGLIEADRPAEADTLRRMIAVLKG